MNESMNESMNRLHLEILFARFFSVYLLWSLISVINCSREHLYQVTLCPFIIISHFFLFFDLIMFILLMDHVFGITQSVQSNIINNENKNEMHQNRTSILKVEI